MSFTEDQYKSFLRLCAPSLTGFGTDLRVEFAVDRLVDTGMLKIVTMVYSGIGQDMNYWRTERTVSPRMFDSQQEFMRSDALKDLEGLCRAFETVAAKNYERGKSEGIESGKAMVLDPLRAVGKVLADAFRGAK